MRTSLLGHLGAARIERGEGRMQTRQRPFVDRLESPQAPELGPELATADGRMSQNTSASFFSNCKWSEHSYGRHSRHTGAGHINTSVPCHPRTTMIATAKEIDTTFAQDQPAGQCSTTTGSRAIPLSALRFECSPHDAHRLRVEGRCEPSGGLTLIYDTYYMKWGHFGFGCACLASSTYVSLY